MDKTNDSLFVYNYCSVGYTKLVCGEVKILDYLCGGSRNQGKGKPQLISCALNVFHIASVAQCNHFRIKRANIGQFALQLAEPLYARASGTRMVKHQHETLFPLVITQLDWLVVLIP